MNQGCFVTGSGIPLFDDLLGGGLLLGGSTLFIEDYHRTYIRYFIRLYAAQGLLYYHNICMISPTDSIGSFLLVGFSCYFDCKISQGLPGVYTLSAEMDSIEDKMTIAWRYQDLPSSRILTGNKHSLSNDFDMSKSLDVDSLVKTSKSPPSELKIDPFSSLESNLHKVLSHIETISKNENNNVTRIFIDSIASPLWGSHPVNLQQCLAAFMARLRLLLRQSFMLVYITVSKAALEESGLNSRWLSYADHVFEVVGFDGLEGVNNMAANPLYDEYHGLLKVLKIPSVSGLNLAPISRPLTYDWAFKVKRRQFVLQLHSKI
ncbi:unnamed protein product [Rodentolepis nana]|uniref:Elongator complex protein 4 n=1 Tax=Rodentolepis nana TaxID=102285 RepID=A0A0R3T6Q3_RODNA|nr:unnamed protein product [Rodentolepis nana]